MSSERLNEGDFQNNIMKMLVSRTLKKHGVSRGNISEEEKQKLRDMVLNLKKQADEFLNNANKTEQKSTAAVSNSIVQEETQEFDGRNNDLTKIWKPTSSPITFRNRSNKK